MPGSPREEDVESMLVPALREEWVAVNGQPTYVLKIGDIQADLPLVVILPGTYTHTHAHARTTYTHTHKHVRTHAPHTPKHKSCFQTTFWSTLDPACNEFGNNENPAITSNFPLRKKHFWLTSMLKTSSLKQVPLIRSKFLWINGRLLLLFYWYQLGWLWHQYFWTVSSYPFTFYVSSES